MHREGSAMFWCCCICIGKTCDCVECSRISFNENSYNCTISNPDRRSVERQVQVQVQLKKVQVQVQCNRPRWRHKSPRKCQQKSKFLRRCQQHQDSCLQKQEILLGTGSSSVAKHVAASFLRSPSWQSTASEQSPFVIVSSPEDFFPRRRPVVADTRCQRLS